MLRKTIFSILAFLAMTVPVFADVMSTPFPFVNVTRTAAIMTTGGTSQTALAANLGRKMFCVVNYTTATESAWIDYGVASVVGTSQEVPIGATLCFGGAGIYQGIITVNAATTSHQITFYEFQ